jgi:type I restriction enzyme M protein
LQTALAVKDEDADPVIRKVHKPGKAEADPMRGRYAVVMSGKPCVVEYEPDSDLRDTEQVPLLEDDGIDAFVKREVLPYVPDAWVDADATKIGYEISFTRYFYTPAPLRTLDEIRADIEALEAETDGLLRQIITTTEVSA